MGKRRNVSWQLVSALLIVTLTVGSLGYGFGRFVTPPERIAVTTTDTTTTTSPTAITTTATQVSTSVVTVTTTSVKVTTSTVVRELPQTFPPPANSSAVIRSFYLLDGSVLATLSVDKPVYSLGETVHFKVTLTNLTPDSLALNLDFYAFYIENVGDHHDVVWTYPEYMWKAALVPGASMRLFLAPNETKTGGQWSGADWNMKGLHLAENGLPVYDDHFAPEGEYTLKWSTYIYTRDKSDYTSLQRINFTITD